MQAYLDHEDLWGCVTGEEDYITENKKVMKAKSKIIFSIDSLNYAHIQETSTAADAWTKLKEAFEDLGLTRKVSLLRTLVTTQLEKCKSVEKYVNIIITTAN